MPSSKDQFPDPWDPNAAGSANQSSGQGEDADAPVPDADSSDDDFGLNELREMLGEETKASPESDMGIDELDSLFPSTSSSDSDFDDLLSSLGLGSAANQNIEEIQSPEIPESLPDIDLSAGDSNIEPILEQPSIDLSAENSGLESVSASESFAVDEPPLELTNLGLPDETLEVPSLDDSKSFAVDDANLELSAESPNLPPLADIPDLDLPSDSGAIGIPNVVESQSQDTAVPELPSLSSDADLGGMSDMSEPDIESLGLADGGSSDTTGSESLGEGLISDSISLTGNFAEDIPDRLPVQPDSPETLGADLSQSPAQSLEDSSETLAETLPDLSAPINDGVESSDLDSDSPELSTADIEDSVTEPIPVIPVPTPTDPSASVNIPVVPPSTPESSPGDVNDRQDSPVGAVASSSSSGRAGAINSTIRQSGPASYKQLLGGRQKIAAFGIILASMGGIAGYGLLKSGINNPLKTDLNEPRAGILIDRNRDDDQATASDPLGIGGGDGENLDQDQGSARSDRNTGQSAIDGNDLSAGLVAPLAASEALSKADEDEDETEAPSSTSAEDVNAVSTPQAPPPIDISDVPPEHWAHSYVVAMHEQGIVPDFPDGKFQPDKPVTRAELAASIQRAFKDKAGSEPIPFSDIPDGYWAKNAVTHAVNTGFMSGYSDDIFEPEQRIPRYQVLVTLVSGLGLEKIEDPTDARSILEDFPDVEAMPEWALGQVAASQKAGLIVGDPETAGSLDPNRPATRAEANAMIYQALVNAGQIEDTAQ